MTNQISFLTSLVKKSYEVYAKLFIKIKTKKMQVLPFQFNRVQRVLWMWLNEELKLGKPIRWDILKSRQLGSSTFIVLFFLWCCTLFKNRNALVVAHDIPSAVELHEKCKLAYACLPDFIKPMQKTSNRRELFFANPDHNSPNIGLQSKVQVDTCDNSDLGASRTIHLVLLSEIARYEKVRDPKEIMLSLNQSVPDVPGTAIFRETTAQGMGYWYKAWKDNKSGYRKIFIPWIASEEYTKPVDPKDYPELSTDEKEYYGNEVLELALIKEALREWYPEWNEPTEENFKRLDHESMCRIVWRRWCIDNKCEGDKYFFMQEYPLTPDQAFIGTGGSVFDQRVLTEWEKSGEPAHHTFKFNEGAYKEFGGNDWWKYSLEADPYGKLTIYELPEEGKSYIIGADVGYGVDKGDESACHVFSVPNLIQVATYHGLITSDYYAYLLYTLGMYYNKALISVEVTGPGGATIQELYHRLYYPRLYYRETRPDQRIHEKLSVLGWSTNFVTKPMMVPYGARAIKERICRIYHPETIRQLRAYIKNDRDEYTAPEGDHDDLVMAMLITFQMMNQVHIPVIPKVKPVFGKFNLNKVLERLDRRDKLGNVNRRDYGQNNLF